MAVLTLSQRSRSEAGSGLVGLAIHFSSSLLHLDVVLSIHFVYAVAIYICRPLCLGSAGTEAIPSLIKNQQVPLAYLP
jgi:hypothetical protein